MSFQVTEVQKAPRGASYPLDGASLSDLAPDNGADRDLVDALRGMREVEAPDGVMKELRGELGGGA